MILWFKRRKYWGILPGFGGGDNNIGCAGGDGGGDGGGAEIAGGSIRIKI